MANFDLVLESTSELYGFLRDNFSSPPLNSPGSVGTVDLDEESEFQDSVRIFPSGPVCLYTPLIDARMKLSLYRGHYSCELSFGIHDSERMGKMRDKLKNRLGEAWSPIGSHFSDPRGYFLDKDKEPIVSGSLVEGRTDIDGLWISPPRYCLSLGTNGAIMRNFGEMEEFTQDMGVLQRVTSAFYDACYSGRTHREGDSVIPANIYFNCLL